MIRTSITIGGTRLSDHDFTRVMINQFIGNHHTFEIRLRQDANRGVLIDKAKSWIGQPVKIGIDNQRDDQIMVSPVKDIFKGIITSMGLSRRSGMGELVVRGESPTILLSDGPNTRSFTEMGLNEIVDEVLQPYCDAFPEPPDVSPKVFDNVLNYCVQYKESNFDFLARLANRYGEWFFYNGLNFYFGKPSDGEVIFLDFGEDSLSYFDISVQAIPAKFEVRGYDYLKHEQVKEEAPIKVKNNDLGKQVLDIAQGKIYTQKPSISVQTALEKGELKNITERIEQINLNQMVVMNGASRNPNLKVGGKIDVKDNLIGESYGAYVITSIMHTIGQGGDYNNSFECIPAEVQSPPVGIIPNPPFCETQLAKVTNVSDEKSLGRVKVKFLWQEDGGEESPWLRVASPYTGKDKGFYVIPEVDDQVLIAFENNNPDKPYVLTGMYNGDAKPEWFDSKNRFKGFKSKGKNQWKFDDKNKSVFIHAPSSITMSAGNKITIKTGGKEDSEINIDVGMGTVNVVAKVVKVEAAETIEMNSQKEIKGAALELIKMESSQDLSISATTNVEIKGTDVKAEGSSNAEVKGATVDVNGSGAVNVKGGTIRLN